MKQKAKPDEATRLAAAPVGDWLWHHFVASRCEHDPKEKTIWGQQAACM